MPQKKYKADVYSHLVSSAITCKQFLYRLNLSPFFKTDGVSDEKGLLTLEAELMDGSTVIIAGHNTTASVLAALFC